MLNPTEHYNGYQITQVGGASNGPDGNPIVKAFAVILGSKRMPETFRTVALAKQWIDKQAKT